MGWGDSHIPSDVDLWGILTLGQTFCSLPSEYHPKASFLWPLLASKQCPYPLVFSSWNTLSNLCLCRCTHPSRHAKIFIFFPPVSYFSCSVMSDFATPWTVHGSCDNEGCCGCFIFLNVISLVSHQSNTTPLAPRSRARKGT